MDAALPLFTLHALFQLAAIETVQFWGNLICYPQIDDVVSHPRESHYDDSLDKES